jgi:hypothetical protein
VLVSIVGTFWFQGIVVETVRDIQDGKRDFDLGTLFRSAAPVIPALIGAGILAGLGIVGGLILLVVPGLILLTWWALIAPVIVVERTGVMPAFGRSRGLVKDNGWQVFGVLAIFFVIQAIASGILTGIFVGISDGFVGYAIGQLLSNVLVAPLSALAAATMYFDLRAIKGEGGVPAGVDPSGAAPAGGTTIPGVPGSTTAPTQPPPPAPGTPPPPPPSAPPPPAPPAG